TGRTVTMVGGTGLPSITGNPYGESVRRIRPIRYDALAHEERHDRLAARVAGCWIHRTGRGIGGQHRPETPRRPGRRADAAAPSLPVDRPPIAAVPDLPHLAPPSAIDRH